VTRRYTELCASLLVLNRGHSSEQIRKDLDALQREFEQLITRHAAELDTRLRQTVFLMNNYDHVIGVLTKTVSVRRS
jgi:hypothetical protein